MAIQSKTKREDSCLPKPDAFDSFNASLISTLLIFALLDTGFLFYSRRFETWRQVRTEFAFTIPATQLMAVMACLLTSTIGRRSRSWIVPVGVGFVLVGITTPSVVWSGPGYLYQAVDPLISLRSMLGMWGWLFNSIFLIAWVCVSKHGAVSRES